MSGPLSTSPFPEFGIDTFGDVTVDQDGSPVPQPQVIRDIVAEAVLADQVGIEHFGVGEHHREDFAVSSPEMVLAAIATQTEQIRLGSSVTVLSSDDPVRVFQRFATLDAVSGGRAEITVGRGSFIESFPLFGFDLADYSILFEERLELLVALRKEEPLTWSGLTRQSLRLNKVYPHTESRRLPVWVGVGGSPESAERAARHGLPMMLAIIGGPAARFQPLVNRYRQACVDAGVGRLPVGLHSPGFVAETDAAAREALYPFFKAGRDRIGAERGWRQLSYAQYVRDIESGSLYVGSPETVAQKIAATVASLDVQRFDFKYSSGAMPHELLLGSIELYGREVIPRVRELLAKASQHPATVRPRTTRPSF